METSCSSDRRSGRSGKRNGRGSNRSPELKRKGVTYGQLVEKLAAIGVKEAEPNIRNKMARGRFTAVFPVQGLRATCTQGLRLG